MICLTADVHHKTLNNYEMRNIDSTEASLALQYVDILKKYDLNVTIFFTGLTGIQEPEKVLQIASQKGVEIGGHTFFAFKHRRLYNLWRKITGNGNGPAFFQNWEIRKTLHVLNNISLCPVVSWRNHAFRSDKNTYLLLKQNGINFVSDLVTPLLYKPRYHIPTRLIEIPINNLTDNDFIYRSSSKYIKGKTINVGGLSDKIMSPREWLKKVLYQTEKIEKAGGISTLLVHPACMKATDDFKLFRELCSELTSYQSICMKDIVNHIDLLH